MVTIIEIYSVKPAHRKAGPPRAVTSFVSFFLSKFSCCVSSPSPLENHEWIMRGANDTEQGAARGQAAPRSTRTRAGCGRSTRRSARSTRVRAARGGSQSLFPRAECCRHNTLDKTVQLGTVQEVVHSRPRTFPVVDVRDFCIGAQGAQHPTTAVLDPEFV
jgi:hypothetical protein